MHLKPVGHAARLLSALLLLGGLLSALSSQEQPGLFAAPAVAAAFPEIILQVNDTTVSPFDDRYYLSVFLTNTLQEVAGLEMTIYAGAPGLVRLPDSIRIDTIITCIDLSDCDPADTAIDTIALSVIDLTGSALAGWDFVEARALSPSTFRMAALADLPGGGTPAPLAVSAGIPHLLFRIALEREATAAVLDTLQERTVAWIIAAPQTSFSDPNGNTIGRQESTICLNPPTCDSLDTVGYFDPTVNIYVDGSLTLGPSCIRGDINQDDAVNAADIISLVSYVFKGGAEPPCSGTAGDVNCSGSITAADIIYLVNYAFKSGPPPCN